MSRITKAIELAKRDGKFQNADIDIGGINRATASFFRSDKLQKVVPDSNVLKSNFVLTAIDDQKIIDTYRLLRTRVLRRMRQNNWKSLGITSAGKNDGKTLTAVNLAISIAMKHNHTIVIVDTDLRNPSINNLFGFNPKYGLLDYLTSDISLEKVLVNPGIDRLFILPGNRRTQGSSELLSSPKMARLAKDLKTRYPTQVVIYDLPPVLVGDDVAAFSLNIDTALLVIEEGGTQSHHLKRSLELLEGIDILGSVLNKSKESVHNSEYYY